MAGAPPGRNTDMDCNGVGPDVAPSPRSSARGDEPPPSGAPCSTGRHPMRKAAAEEIAGVSP
jgi:hypothetical protein